jgi:hypothetical protein
VSEADQIEQEVEKAGRDFGFACGAAMASLGAA